MCVFDWRYWTCVYGFLKIDWLKYYTNTTAVEMTFRRLAKGKFEHHEPIDKTEYKWIEATHNGGLTFCNSLNTSLLLKNNNQGTFYYHLNTTGITNSTNPIKNNSTVSQVGAATFTNYITAPGIKASTGVFLLVSEMILIQLQ